MERDEYGTVEFVVSLGRVSGRDCLMMMEVGSIKKEEKR
jgi:hypothetical protein